MEEIKTVIDRLKEKLERLENENNTDLNSIKDKQASISSLDAEINELQAGIEARKESMAKLEQKKSEAELFDKSIEEVAPLIDKEELDDGRESEVTEEVKEENAVQEEAKEEAVYEPAPTPEMPAEDPEPIPDEPDPVVKEQETQKTVVNPTAEEDNNVMYPFGDITGDLEVKEDPFKFKGNMDEYNVPVDATVQPMNTEGGPVFDERGFDISATVENNQPVNPLPDIGLNEMYNIPMDNDQSMMAR